MRYARYAIRLDTFGHDLNGNVIAHHTVLGYGSANLALDHPEEELYATRRRMQIGAGERRADWAPSALRLAGLPANLKITKTEGGRSEGAMYLIYDIPQGEAA